MTVSKNLAEIVIARKYLNGTFLKHNKTDNSKQLANYLRKDISERFNELPDMKWSPSSEEL